MIFTEYKKHLFIFIILLISIPPYSTAFTATPGNNMAGVWSGIVTDTKTDDLIKIDLTITTVAGNTNSYQYSLHYGTPRSCRLETEELSLENNIILLKFKAASDLKFCYVLFKKNSSMKIKITGDNRLNVEIKNSSGFSETTTLKKK